MFCVFWERTLYFEPDPIHNYCLVVYGKYELFCLSFMVFGLLAYSWWYMSLPVIIYGAWLIRYYLWYISLPVLFTVNGLSGIIYGI